MTVLNVNEEGDLKKLSTDQVWQTLPTSLMCSRTLKEICTFSSLPSNAQSSGGLGLFLEWSIVSIAHVKDCYMTVCIYDDLS